MLCLIITPVQCCFSAAESLDCHHIVEHHYECYADGVILRHFVIARCHSHYSSACTMHLSADIAENYIWGLRVCTQDASASHQCYHWPGHAQSGTYFGDSDAHDPK